MEVLKELKPKNQIINIPKDKIFLKEKDLIGISSKEFIKKRKIQEYNEYNILFL